MGPHRCGPCNWERFANFVENFASFLLEAVRQKFRDFPWFAAKFEEGFAEHQELAFSAVVTMLQTTAPVATATQLRNDMIAWQASRLGFPHLPLRGKMRGRGGGEREPAWAGSG